MFSPSHRYNFKKDSMKDMIWKIKSLAGTSHYQKYVKESVMMSAQNKIYIVF